MHTGKKPKVFDLNPSEIFYFVHLYKELKKIFKSFKEL